VLGRLDFVLLLGSAIRYWALLGSSGEGKKAKGGAILVPPPLHVV
jgi:hypothetical protein